MSATKAALASLNAAARGLPRNVRLPPKSATSLLAEGLGGSAADAVPAKSALEALRARMLAALGEGRLDGVTRRDLRDTPWIMWQGDRPLAHSPALLGAIFKEATVSARALRNLIEAWLRDYAPDAPGIAAAAEVIRRLLPAYSNDRRLAQWRGAHEAFSTFDASSGPARLANALLDRDEQIDTLLARAGLDDELRAVGGYFRMTLLACLSRAPALLRDRSADAKLGRLLDILAPQGTLRFGRELHGSVGRALLEAWCDGGREPVGTVRDTVRDFLLRQLRDPRIQPANWAAVGDRHASVMKRWLARASLKAFFELISDHALDHQWRYRQAFWSACLERGAIEDAWLALGARAHWSARAVSGLHGAYGKLEGSGGDQSVLLMRIGPLTLCEWSHNGKLRAWPTEWQNAPRLNRASYTREDLTGAGLPFPPNAKYRSRGSSDGMGLSHVGSEGSRWQGSAAELLARRADLRLTHEDWNPK